MRLHMIGHGHIDPVWLWRWQEGCEEVRATFRSALARMRETPDFTFTASSAAFYAWARDVDPDMFREIQERVREGRWEIAGGFWVEPDCNIPHGEAFVRQGLYAQAFFKEAFGRTAKIGFNPDSFGHAAALPQILRKLGISAYVYMRPAPEDEYAYPEGTGTTFRWRAADESSVLAIVIPVSYGGDDLPAKVAGVRAWPFLMKGQKEVLCFYGVGNHGGGPTKKAVADILAMQQSSPDGVVFSTLERYLEASRGNPPEQALPTVTGDLQHHARGCYSAHSEIKRLNRECEHALMAAERFATAVWLGLGVDGPAGKLRQAWKRVLFNQFHDILAGTSVREAYDDARDSFGEAKQTAEESINASLTAVARSIDTSGEGNCVLVFNPLPWPVVTSVEVTPRATKGLGGTARFTDASGRAVPTQEILYGHVGSKAHVFWAEIPPLGCRLYRAVRSAGAGEPNAHRTLSAETERLENDFWRLEVNPDTGELTRLRDKRRGVEVIEQGGLLSVLRDESDTWSHGIERYDKEEGSFGNARVRVFELGEVRATLRISMSFGRSTAEHYVTIHRESERICGRLDIDWREAYRCLKLVFRTRLEKVRATCEVPYGYVERRPDGGEEPCGAWVEMSGELDGDPYGFALLNDCKYAFDAKGGELRLTLLRSPAYAHHDPARYDSSEPYPIIDQGLQTMHYEIVPHPGDWREACIPRRAWELNEPAVCLVESGHKGEPRTEVSYLRVAPGNVIASVLKRPEEGEGLILRLCEAHGEDVQAEVAMPFLERRFTVPLKAHEIKTLRVFPAQDWRSEEVDLLEQAGPPGEPNPS